MDYKDLMGCITASQREGKGESLVDCNGLEMSAELEMRVQWNGEGGGGQEWQFSLDTIMQS